MNSSLKVWMPAGNLTETQRLVLSVPASSKPEPDSLYRELLAAKLQALVDADPEAARRHLEMSQDHAPELWAIAEEASPSEWGQRLASSEGMARILNKADLSKPGSLTQAEPLELTDLLEMIA
jgi:hypothetical protein